MTAHNQTNANSIFESPYQIELAHCPACAWPALRRVRRPAFVRKRHSSLKRKRPVYGITFCCPFARKTLFPDFWPYDFGLFELGELPAIRDAWIAARGIEAAPGSVKAIIADAERLESSVFAKAA